MQRLLIMLMLFFAGKGFSQPKFDSSKVSAKILLCVQNIDRITSYPNFDNIDSTRKQYSKEIWMEMPYATNPELFELTNHPNKFVRIHAFDLLVQFRDQIDTALMILNKNIGDTSQFIEELDGCFLYKRSVFEHMIRCTFEWWEIQKARNSSFLSKEQQISFDWLLKQVPKQGV